MHCLERYTAGLDIGGDCIDDGVDPGDSAGDRGLIAHVGADHCDPLQAHCA